MKYNIISMALVVISISACTKEVILNVPAQPARLVIESNTAAGDVFVAYVTQSVDVLAPISRTPLATAFITLLEGSVVRDTLLYNTGSKMYTAKNGTRALAGKTYTLRGTAAGYPAADATMAVPVPVPITAVIYQPKFRTNSNGNQVDEVRFTLQDMAGSANFYRISIRRPVYPSGNNMEYQDVYCLATVDPDAETGLGGTGVSYDDCIDQDFVMKDVRFDGRSKELTLQINSFDMEPLRHPTTGVIYRPVVMLTSITGDYYRYYKSRKIYEDAQDNPFAEPVSIFTNIKQGYGIFSAYSSTVRVIQ